MILRGSEHIFDVSSPHGNGILKVAPLESLKQMALVSLPAADLAKITDRYKVSSCVLPNCRVIGVE
jgi:hypothetical protein